MPRLNPGSPKWLRGALVMAALSGVGAGAWAQTRDQARLEFDVASVKQNRSDAATTSSNFPLGPGDVYVANGGSFVATNFPLIVYISFAYRITSNQGAALRRHLPDW